MRTRLGIAALIFMMMQGVLFGIGTVTILSTSLSDDARALMPAMVVLTIVVAMPLSWWLAPRLRARYWRRHDGDRSVTDKALSALS